MRIWIDADACPKAAKELVCKFALKRKLEVWMVAGQPQVKPPFACVRLVVVESGMDAADDYLVEQAEPGDLAICSDVPLADRLIKKQVAALDPRGREFDARNMGDKLAMRNLMADLRDQGQMGGGQAPYAERDRQAFATPWTACSPACSGKPIYARVSRTDRYVRRRPACRRRYARSERTTATLLPERSGTAMGGERPAASRAQVVDAQVDGAELRQPRHALVAWQFAMPFEGADQGHRSAGDVEQAGDHPAVENALNEVADQFVLHRQVEDYPLAAEAHHADAEHAVEGDALEEIRHQLVDVVRQGGGGRFAHRGSRFDGFETHAGVAARI